MKKKEEEKKMKKVLSLLLTVIMILSLIVTVASAAGESLTIGASGEVAYTAAWRIRSPQDKLSWSCVYELLFVLDDEGNIIPNLAKSLESDVENKTYTVTLREDVYFSDGSHLDADILLWNFENFKENSQTSSTHFGDVESFEKTGDYTVVIHLTEWNSQIPYSLTSIPGLMYSKQAFEEHGYDWCLKNPVGTGPFVLETWVNDEYKTFVKNENYWNKNVDVPLDDITIRIIGEEMAAQAALLSGDIDGYFGASFSMQDDLMKKGFNVYRNQMWYRIMFLIYASAMEDTPISDVRVRQAMCYAIDSESISEKIDYGLSIPSNQYAVEGTMFYNEDVEGYGYNVEKAKALLADAGYADGFTTTLYTGVDQPLESYMVAIQGYLADIGIKVNLEFQEVSLWVGKTLFDIDEGMILAGHGFGINLVNQMVSNFSKRAVEGVGMLKMSKLHPDDLDKVIMAALRAQDSETMIKNAKMAEKFIIDEYCLGYPVVIGNSGNIMFNSNVVDEHTFETNNEFFDYTKIHFKD